MKYLVLALVAVALVFGVRCMTIRKDLVSERQAIDADWAQVDAALAHTVKSARWLDLDRKALVAGKQAARQALRIGVQ